MTTPLRLPLLAPAAILLTVVGAALLQHRAGPWALPLSLLWSLGIAAGLLWWSGRERAAWNRSITRLSEQAQALAEGRFVFVDDDQVADLQPLVRVMNLTVGRMRGVFEATARPSETLRRQAQPDPVTGLDNRGVFLQRLTERLGDPAHPDCALLVVRLALPGDPTSHPGDDSAQRVLEAMSDMLGNYPHRVPGAFVGRLGETDFALCLPAHGLAAETATTLLAAWRAGPVGQLGGAPCVVGAVDRLGGQPVSLALSIVEHALADAQARGPFTMQVCAAREPLQGDPGSGRLGILRALDEGGAKLAEFPVLDAQQGLLHLECPMRLRRDPDGPWESAEQWLTLAARHRLMAQVDMKAVQLALRAIAADGVPRCAHVSSQSLLTAGFASAVREMLEADSDAARRLWIEIAEVSFESLPQRLRNACTAWRRSGVRLGIEHAGTGLKNLVGIEDLGLDYVKVASTFACGTADDEGQRDRARGMVALVHSLGAMIIAEGVDRLDDIDALWSLGFDGITGPAITAQRRSAESAAQLMSPA